MNQIRYRFHVVDRLPHGAAVLRVEDGDETHTYLSREAGLEQIAADAERTASVLMQQYEWVAPPERHARRG